MFTGIDLVLFALAMIGFGYVLSATGNKSSCKMKQIFKKEETCKAKGEQVVTRYRGEGIAERNRREYDLIAQADKQTFIEQLIK